MKPYFYTASLVLLAILSGCVKEDKNCYEALSESCAAVIEVAVWDVGSDSLLGMSRTEIAFGSMPERFLIDKREQSGALWLSREGVSREPISARPTILKAELDGPDFYGVEVTLDMNKRYELKNDRFKWQITLSPRTSTHE